MRTTLLVGAGRAHQIAKLLDAVAHAINPFDGHAIDAPDGTWHLRIAPDGSIDMETPGGAAVLRGALAEPAAVAAAVMRGVAGAEPERF